MTERFQPLAKFTRKGADLDSVRAAHIAVMARYEAAGIPSEYFGITLDNSPVRDDQTEIYRALDVYADTFSQDVRHKGIYMTSSQTGNGKSTSAIALTNEWIRRRFLYYVKNGKQVPEILALFMDVTEFQNTYNMATMTKNQEMMDKVAKDIARFSEVPFLCVDDIGVRAVSDALRGYLHTIINARTSNRLPTVYTSNERMDTLKRTFDKRIYDRVRDQTIEFTFSGESKRGVR